MNREVVTDKHEGVSSFNDGVNKVLLQLRAAIMD